MTDVSHPQSEVSPAGLPALPPCESASGASGEDKPWSSAYALVMCWLKPATSARRLLHIGLLEAFAVHIASGLLFLVGATALIAIIERDSPFEVWGSLITAVTRHPGRFFIGLTIVCGVIEVMAFGLALLLTPWGARDEKLRSSLYHTMRTVWLQSMHVAVATLLLLGFVVSWTEAWSWVPGMNWYDQPWYIRHNDDIFGYFAFAVYGWALWGMLRAVGARPVIPPADAPPVCQRCGYNLTGAAVEGLCPECGEPVLASLGPDARAGILWERRGGLPLREARLQTARQMLRCPRRFGRDLQIYSPPGESRRFLLISVIAAGLVGSLGAIGWLLGFIWGRGFYESMFEDLVWLIAPGAAIWAGLGVLAISLIFAGIFGVAVSWGAGRNAMPAAVRSACYLSFFLVLWGLVNVPAAFVYGSSGGIQLFDDLASRLRIDDEEVALLGWGILNLVGLCMYLRLFWAMLQGARYANR